MNDRFMSPLFDEGPPFCLLRRVVAALLVAARVSASDPSSSESTSGLLSGVRVMYKTYQQCEDQGEVMGCLKMRALRLLERALVLENIPLMDGKSLSINDRRRFSLYSKCSQ